MRAYVRICKDPVSCSAAEEKIKKLNDRFDTLQRQIKSRIIQEELDHFDTLWEQILPADKIELLDSVIEKVEIYPDRIWTYLNPDFLELESELASQMASAGILSHVKREGELLIFATPITVHSYCGRTRLEIIGEAYENNRRCLLHAVALSWKWTEMFFSGNISSVQVLAKQVGFSCAYVTRILSLSNLAPSIVEDILNGKIPENMSLAKIYEGFPDDWSEQREKFGFSVQ